MNGKQGIKFVKKLLFFQIINFKKKIIKYKKKRYNEEFSLPISARCAGDIVDGIGASSLSLLSLELELELLDLLL